jgi:two-component system, LuxR family, sensor kinase FixL
LPPVAVEAVQIQQLLLNLVRNALEALEARDHGKREIRITTGTTADGHIELCVMDNGPGVDPQVQPDMFEPFVTTKPFGTGLGLAISRTIAQNHGGQLLYRSSECGGTCFALRLRTHEGAPGQ